LAINSSDPCYSFVFILFPGYVKLILIIFNSSFDVNITSSIDFNPLFMKKISISLLFVFYSIFVLAQNIDYQDGLYYKKGMLFTGQNIEHFENGKIQLEQNIKNGLVHGKMTLYYSNGNAQEQREYNEGKKHGTWINWSEEGVKTAEAAYKNDIKDGDWYIWDNMGTLLYEMHYTLGKRSGVWRKWDENGKLDMEREYE